MHKNRLEQNNPTGICCWCAVITNLFLSQRKCLMKRLRKIKFFRFKEVIPNLTHFPNNSGLRASKILRLFAFLCGLKYKLLIYGAIAFAAAFKAMGDNQIKLI